jgi:hypothetical protein
MRCALYLFIPTSDLLIFSAAQLSTIHYKLSAMSRRISASPSYLPALPVSQPPAFRILSSDLCLLIGDAGSVFAINYEL